MQSQRIASDQSGALCEQVEKERFPETQTGASQWHSAGLLCAGKFLRSSNRWNHLF
jgi:hypothetical protein